MEIVEVLEDIKGKVGDKAFYVLGAGAILFGLYNLSKGSGGNSGDNLVPVTNVASYPDSVTNADVIISTLQDSIEYSENVIVEKLEGLEEQQQANSEKVTESFININEKLESNKELFNTAFENMQGSLNDLDKNVTSIAGNVTNIAKEQSNIKNSIDTIKNAVNKVGTTVSNKENTTTTTCSNKTTASNNATGYYTYKTASGLNTATSIVDALKAIGVNSSMENRTKIAKANGITNYTGTYSQNVQLLSKLKTGKLKKV